MQIIENKKLILSCFNLLEIFYNFSNHWNTYNKLKLLFIYCYVSFDEIMCK
jgi:hypothetical protein